MNITHLRYIVEVAATGSITKAAQNLYMGQPNLSKAIKDMEKSVGAPIFMRTSKGVVLTKKGAEIIAFARSIIAQADEFEEKFLEGGGRRRFTAAISGIDYCCAAFEQFAAAYEDEREIVFSCLTGGNDRVISLVEDREADLGVIRVRENESFTGRFKMQLLGRGTEMILVREDSPVAAKEEIFSGDLEGFTEVTIGAEGSSKNVQAYDFNGGCRLLSVLEKGFMRISSLDANIPKGFIAVKSGEKTAYCDYLIYSDDKRLSEAEREFLRCLRQFLN